LAAVLALAGCGNGYTQFYSPANPSTWSAKLLPATAPVEIVEAGDDLAVDTLRFYEDGYAEIGRSSFAGPREGRKNVIAQATAVGAQKVVLLQRYNSTRTDVSTSHHTTPVITPNPSGFGTTTTLQRTTDVDSYNIAIYRQTAGWSAPASAFSPRAQARRRLALPAPIMVSSSARCVAGHPPMRRIWCQVTSS
jgi:hypothetical protein